ncbi:MAG: uroporphyrinogen decarboxylase family protein [Limnochordia bacterium]
MFDGGYQPDFAGFKRVLLRQGEPDRVFFYELFADREIMEAVLGHPLRDERDHIAYQLKIGYDYVRTFLPGCAFPTTGLLKAADTAQLSRGQRVFHPGDMGCIKNWADFENYAWPKPENFDFSAIERMTRYLPDGMKITLLLGHVLEDAMNLMGYEGLAIALYDQPDLVEALFQKIGETYEAAYKACAQLESTGFLIISDDLGFKTSTMFAPDMLRRYVFPWYKKYCDVCHAYDVPVVLHSCGNLTEVMDDLIACGIDAKHSYEDQILPVTEAKRLYGDRWAILGGIDVDFLCRATEAEIRERVRTVLDVCMPGGGYALGTGNTVANYIPVPNFLAMIEEGRRWTP